MTDGLLEFIRVKFYPGDNVAFAKDRRLLLKWVVLYFAAWLDGKAVSLPLADYKDIVTKVLMEAAVHGTGKIKYRPAYLRYVLQSHLRIHGEDYYNKAKAVRNLADNALALVGRLAVKTADPIKDLATAARLIDPKKRTVKAPVKEQLTLL